MTGGPFSAFGPVHPDRVDGVCTGFAWVGQSFAHCATCGEPFWDHETLWSLGDGGWSQFVLTPAAKAACRMKWERPV